MRIILILICGLLFPICLCGQEDRGYQVFQFPADRIPRIDGYAGDWNIVPPNYTVGMDQLWDDSKKHPAASPENLSVSVKVGWVKGMNRLYFLYEAYDDYWDFSRPDLHNDTFELIVDGDLSGGPFIDRFHPNKEMDPMSVWFSFHGVQAQNYHIFTPAEGKDWTLVWGSQPWIKELPYANAAYQYDFKPGEAGKLTLEFWVTPFDYAGNDPARAVESVLYENKKIGLCWAVIDYDDVEKEGNNGFWNLSKEHTMYGNASHGLVFELMPLEKQFQKPVEAKWSFQVLDGDRRLVAFTDESSGEIDSWKWDFGDGETSAEQHPLHQYTGAGKYVVVLWVEGPEGKSRLSKVWDVVVK
ncbi:PKD domain-containing protein [Gaoshiqia sp. Z1-71]|uniref:PKD domain-containing protein n=1 Tax=Gaoshiqia hydrogeniformans TaxID=3290090 RepID=UPI003BF7FAAD